MTLALCIPAYNAAWCLPRLLASAHAQTVKFDEVLVYDDCSTDDTAAIAMSFGARVLRGVINRGCSHGKNRLAQECGTDWIHFHDADDELMSNFVELAHGWMHQNLHDVVLFDYEERDELTGHVMGYRLFSNSELQADARSYAIREQINAICGLYRRSSFINAGGYDDSPLVLYNEDVAMHIRLAFAGLHFASESRVSIINHRRMDSMSSSNRLKCQQAQYQVMINTVKHPGSDKYFHEIAQRLWRLTGVLAAELDWVTARAAAKLALSLDGLSSANSGVIFRLVCCVSPIFALYFREFLIRLLKPRYRIDSPGWRSPFDII